VKKKTEVKKKVALRFCEMETKAEQSVHRTEFLEACSGFQGRKSGRLDRLRKSILREGRAVAKRTRKQKTRVFAGRHI